MLKNIDFNNPNILRAILAEEKHTRIEGLCSEIALVEDIINNNIKTVTYDYWFSPQQEGYNVYKLVFAPLTDLDYRLLDLFASKAPLTKTYIAYFYESKKEFYYFAHVKGARYDKIGGKGTVLMESDNQLEINPFLRIETRLKKALDFIEARNLLKIMVIKRIFANNFVDPGFEVNYNEGYWKDKKPKIKGGVWDIDAFTITPKNRIVALEVKQKYPFKRWEENKEIEKFGLNVPQEFLFEFLNVFGIEVIYVILEKPDASKYIPGIDFLEKPEYKNKNRWLFTLFSQDKLDAEISTADESTSLRGKTLMDYRGIATSHFEFLKFYQDHTNDSNLKARLIDCLDERTVNNP